MAFRGILGGFLVLFLSGCAHLGVRTERLGAEVSDPVREYNEIAIGYLYGTTPFDPKYRKDVKAVVKVSYTLFLRNASQKIRGLSKTEKMFKENEHLPDYNYDLAITDAQLLDIKSYSQGRGWHESFIYSIVTVDHKYKFRCVHKTLITIDLEDGEIELWSCELVKNFMY